MKTKSNEILFLILSLILIGLSAGVYLIFGQTQSAATTVTTTTANTTSSSSSSTEEELLADAQRLVAVLSTSLTREAITNAQAAINKVEDETQKSELQAQLDAKSTELTNQETAEAAVKAAETHLTVDSLTTAQAAVNALTDETLIANLQARLDAVSTAIYGTSTEQSSDSDTAYYYNY